MKIIGNLELLEKKIVEKYTDQFKQIELETQKEIERINIEANKKIALILDQAKTDAIEEANQASQRVFNEQKLKAKKEFEFKREKLIENVFSEVKKQAPKMALGKEYKAFVKKNMLKGAKVNAFGSSPAFKKFVPKMTIDKTITGVRFESESIVHDLSIDGALESNHEKIRRIIINQLLEEK